MVIIPSRRFSIRQYTVGDLPSLVKAFGHRQVLRGARGPVGSYRLIDGRKFLREKLRQYRRQPPVHRAGEIDTLGYAVEIHGRLAGGVGVTITGPTAEIGYWLAQPYWGQGIMTMVVRAWSQYAVQHFKVRRLEAKTFQFNQASIAVLQKNDFRFEARQVQSMNIRGKYFDELLFVKILK